ncbi:MAG: SEC-C metal-binding domain-containing protein [Turicibacter sanguinis]|uniref:YecA family protein n=1 Tax=Turicibacter sanguinis TaxID=154288 RepID=UPI002F92CC0A
MQNMNGIIKESMIANAIKCNYDEKLETILNKLKKPELKRLVDHHGLKGCSSLAKGGLIERIIATLGDVSRLEYILCGMDDLMMSDFVMLVNEAYVNCDEMMSSSVYTLYNLGYVYPVMNGKEVVYMMPQVVKEAYANISQPELQDTKVRTDLVYLYLKALVNLYGICDFAQLCKVFNEYETTPLTPEEALNVLFCKLTFHGNVQSFGPLFVSDSLLIDSEQEVLALRETQEEKEYYMPTKEEIQQFGMDEGEWTPQLMQVQKFIEENICEDKKVAREIAHEMGMSFAYKYQPKLAFMALEGRQIEMESYNVGQALMILLMDAFNHARTWENRGFRQVDLEASAVKEVASTQVVVPMINPIKSTKIGRNEPCPCGSQKKYKKCCGR